MTRLGVALALYRWSLRCLPGHFRAEYAAELEAVVRLELVDASQGGIRFELRLLREVLDVLEASVRVRLAGSPPPIGHGQRERGGMTSLFRNLRITARTLARQRSFTLAAILTLGIGVGSAAAAFGVWNALLLQPLPHHDANRLVMIWRDVTRLELTRAPMSYPTLMDVREQSAAVFSGVEAYSGGAPALLNNGEPENVNGARVTGGLFGLLGNRPLLGRVITPADDKLGAEPVVVLSHALWLRYFAGDPTVVGRMIDVREQLHRVVGVMGPEFVFPSPRSALWVPLRADPARQQRDQNYLVAVGRLRDGAMPARAQTQLDVIHARLAQSHPSLYEDGRFRLESRHEYVVGDARRVVLLGVAAASLLLLIACANLGNLLLVRGLARGRELTVRSALGAARTRIAAELVSEALLIGAAGAALGCAVAFALTRLVVGLAPDALPRRGELGLNAHVILFAAVTGVFCALVCAIAPVLLRVEPGRVALATFGGSVSQRGRRLQSGLAIAQVSLALVLLVIAGLLTSTLNRLLGVPTGFQGDRVLTAWVSLPQKRYSSREQIASFYDQLFRRLSALPGVERVGGTWALPFSEDFASSRFMPAGGDPDVAATISTAPVSGGYFDVVGMRLISGRNFDERDRADAVTVGIINETLARRFWPGRSPLGQRMVDPTDADDVVTVIGVVSDVRRRDLATDVEPELYMAHAQSTWDGSMSVTMRTSGDPMASAAALRAEIHALDRLLPVARVTTLDALVRQSVATPRFRAAIIAALSATALLLTLLGVYSVQAVFVASTRRDLAVRLALGARPRRVIAEVMARGLRLTLFGVVLGSILAFTAARSLNAVLFDLSPLDPTTWATTIALLLGAAAVACWIPVRRLSRLDPMVTLRTE